MNTQSDVSRLLATAMEHHRQGKLAEAEKFYRRILLLAPENGDALNLLGVVAIQAGQFPAALELTAKAAALYPDIASYHGNLGLACKHLHRDAEAEAHYRKALALDPALADAHYNLGDLLLAQGRFNEAAQSYREVVRHQPSHVHGWHNLAFILMQRKSFAEALACYRTLTALQPTADNYCNLARALERMGQPAQAEAAYREALKRDPAHARSWNNLGSLLHQELGRAEEAIAYFRQALAQQPDYAEAHMGLGMALLSRGEMKEGFAQYEWRLRVPHYAATLPTLPLWRGEDMRGKTLLLCAEQGMGDTIQFCRYAPLAAQKARVIVSCPPSLARLLKSLDRVDRVVSEGVLPQADAYAPMASLPYLFGTTPDTVSASVPYLAPRQEDVRRWREELGQFRGRKVGLCWAGNPLLAGDARRSVPAEMLAPLADVEGVNFISLQKNAVALAPLALFDRTMELKDFADTAALIAALDLVISVDTAVAHLAGALGKPVWLLNRFAGDWRWMEGRDDSPWYPGLRQFRQGRQEGWGEVMARVAGRLAESAA